MPPRKRNAQNRALPARWRYKHGAYYYRVPPGLEHLWDGRRDFRLGKTLAEAHRTWAERIELGRDARTIGELLDRYAAETIPKKAPKTQADNRLWLSKLRAVFGHMPLEELEPWHIYQYVDRRSAKTAAIKEAHLLQHAYTKAVEWGLIRRNPLIGQLDFRGRTPARTRRYVEDWEILAALSLQPHRRRGSIQAVQAFIRLALLTGLRRKDILLLHRDGLRDDGLHVTPTKTEHSSGKSLIYEWTDELREAVELALAARPVDISPWVFCTKRGQPYIDERSAPSGWNSMWRRFMDRVVAETNVEAPFTQHDLRAKAGSDAEDRERARELLAHADARTTERSYRRRPTRVRPAKFPR